MRKNLKLAAVAVATAFLLAVVAACGGGGYGDSTPPPPPTLFITTTSLPDGVVGTAYSPTVAATGGSGPRTFSISAGTLPAGLSIAAGTGVISGTPAGPAGTSNFTVMVVDSGGSAGYGGTPQQSDTQALTIDIVDPLLITTGALSGATIGAAYNQTVVATGGTAPYSFSLSAGTLPAGLAMNAATGAITGPATATATNQTFTVRVADGSVPQLTDTQVLTIVIMGGSLGRNDSIATATTLAGNGTFSASISPSGNPNTILDPDEDYYRITTVASDITVDINAQSNGSPLDSVIELLAANGVRLNTCVSPGFVSACVHDDETLGVVLDSFLVIRVSGATTFFLHVVEFRGDGRPDLLYDIVITGVT